MNTHINIEDHVTPALKTLLKGVSNKRSLHKAMGMGVETLVRTHLRTTKATKRNRLGATSTGFWQKVLASVTVSANESEAVVSIPYRGAALHYYGGTISPVNGARNIAIPARTEAHGKTPRKFKGEQLRFIMFRSGSKALAGRRSGLVYYWLKDQVTIPEDKSVLPTDSDMSDAALQAAANYLAATAYFSRARSLKK